MTRPTSRVLSRGMRRCTVHRLLGGACAGDVDLVTVFYGEPVCACRAHSHLVAELLDELARRREPKPPRCGHLHRSSEARAICERRLERARA
jgi:hypothetical protein